MGTRTLPPWPTCQHAWENHAVLAAETAAYYLRGLAYLVAAWPDSLRAGDPGIPGHEEVGLFVNWSLRELARGLDGLTARQRLVTAEIRKAKVREAAARRARGRRE